MIYPAQRIASFLKAEPTGHDKKMRWTWIMAWPLGACVVAAAAWGLLYVSLEQDRQDAEADALNTAQAVARSYAAQLARTMEAVDQTLIHVRFEWQLSRGTLALEKIDRRQFFFPSTVANVIIVNRDGKVLTTTLSQRGSRAERSYFLEQKESGRDSLFISTPLTGRVTLANIIPFTRPLFDQDGNFDGTVETAIHARYFTESYDRITLGQNGLLGVAGSEDHIFRVVRVGSEVYSAETAVSLKPPPTGSGNGAALLDGRAWFRDGRSRYLGWQKLRAYPLIAYSGLDARAALAPYHTDRNATIQHAWWATAGLFIFSGLAMLLSYLPQRHRHELAKVQRAYRLATEEGLDGFFILCILGAEKNATADFEIIDCNAQGAKLFGCPRSALIGTRLSTHLPRSQYRRLQQRLEIASATGSYEGELPAFLHALPQVRWLHLKVVRSDSHLAATVTDVSEARAHLKELERRSNEDALTMLPNRYWVQAYLPQAISIALTKGTLLAVLFVDLDGFKKINDAIGHLAGDELLRQAASRLKRAVRPRDRVARLGGDEFVIILEDIGAAGEAADIAQRVLAAFEEGFHYQHRVHEIGASIGISLCPIDGTQAETLLKSADIAMYAVKTTEKGCCRFFEPRMLQVLQSRLETEMQLRHALKNDELVVYYQPRIDLASGATSSLEALVRWIHPQRGLISPNEFIPLAEETGLIIPLGEAVIEKVFAQVASWARSSGSVVPVSINVSPRQLHEVDIPQIFSDAFNRHKVDPALIEVEITESSMVGEAERALEAIKALQGMGVKVLIDDFGTGYSSLSQLQELNFDVLKIDRSFTLKGNTSTEGEAFLDAIITMAHALGMHVVAEGVENMEQLKVLKRLQCDEAQGFLFSVPLPPEDRQPTASVTAVLA
jgi:diguanylate cyclase (GGDEF)-like protein